MNNFESQANNNDVDNMNDSFIENSTNEEEFSLTSDEIFDEIVKLGNDKGIDKENIKKIIQAFIKVDAHYGHKKSAWNPLMSKYLFGEYNGVHIIDLTKTIYLLKKVLTDLIKLFSENNARMLFVGSKEQIVDIIKEEAEKCGQYFVNYRWFGGTLTNWPTIQKSLKKMDRIERDLAENKDTLNKKEIASRQRILNKLLNSLGGIRQMSNLPDIVFVTDTRKEKVAILEANKLGIPVIALLDSNSSPIGIDYPIPCNDDKRDAIELVTKLISSAVLAGMEISFDRREKQEQQRASKRKNFVRGSRFEANKNDEKQGDDSQAFFEQKEDNSESCSTDNKNQDDSSKDSSQKPQSSAKLKKSFVSLSKKDNQKFSNSGGFSSAASLLKKKTSPQASTTKNNTSKTTE